MLLHIVTCLLQQKELFSSARKPAASVSKMSAVLDCASISKLKEAELEVGVVSCLSKLHV